MIRSARQARILELIGEREINTQEELSRLLSEKGIIATQATISRDIKELGLIKVLSDKGGYKYSAIKNAASKASNKLINVLRETVISLAVAQNQVIVKTLDGSAATVSNIINHLGIGEILAAVEGYNALLIVTKDNNDALLVLEKLEGTLR